MAATDHVVDAIFGIQTAPPVGFWISLTWGYRIQLLWSSPGTFPRRHPGARRSQGAGHFGRRPLRVGHRDRPAQLRAGQCLHAHGTCEPHCSQTARKTFRGTAFRRRTVSVPWSEQGEHVSTDERKSFVPPSIAKKYDFDMPTYDGIDQIVEIATTGGKI